MAWKDIREYREPLSYERNKEKAGGSAAMEEITLLTPSTSLPTINSALNGEKPGAPKVREVLLRLCSADWTSTPTGEAEFDERREQEKRKEAEMKALCEQKYLEKFGLMPASKPGAEEVNKNYIAQGGFMELYIPRIVGMDAPWSVEDNPGWRKQEQKLVDELAWFGSAILLAVRHLNDLMPATMMTRAGKAREDIFGKDGPRAVAMKVLEVICHVPFTKDMMNLAMAGDCMGLIAKADELFGSGSPGTSICHEKVHFFPYPCYNRFTVPRAFQESSFVRYDWEPVPRDVIRLDRIRVIERALVVNRSRATSLIEDPDREVSKRIETLLEGNAAMGHHKSGRLLEWSPRHRRRVTGS